MLACDTTLFNIVLCTQRASERERVGRKISIIINGSFYLHYVSMSAAAPALCHLTHFWTTFKSKHVQQWGCQFELLIALPMVVIWDNFPGCVITDERERANYGVGGCRAAAHFQRKLFLLEKNVNKLISFSRRDFFFIKLKSQGDTTIRWRGSFLHLQLRIQWV